MQRSRPLALLALALLLAAPLAAAKKKKQPAIVDGTVKDESGEAVSGVAVTVTSPDDPNFRQEAKTDRKGTFSLEIADPTATYFYRLDKDGHDPQINTLEIEPGKRYSFDFTLPSRDSEFSRQSRAVESYNAGAKAYNEGDTASARQRFQEAIEASPAMVDAHVGLGNVLLGEKDWAGAMASAEAILGVQADDARGLWLRFEAARGLGEAAALENAVKGLVGSDEAANGAVLLYNEGVATLQEGDRTRARSRFELATTLNQNMPPAYSALASLAYNDGDYPKALEHVETLLALAPADAHGLRLRYLTFDALGDSAKADEAFQAMATAHPDRAVEELYQRADELFRSGDMDRARAAAERVLSLQPDHVEANYTAGLTCFNAGEKAKARAYLGRVVELAPDSQKARDAQEILKYMD